VCSRSLHRKNVASYILNVGDKTRRYGNPFALKLLDHREDVRLALGEQSLVVKQLLDYPIYIHFTAPPVLPRPSAGPASVSLRSI
jgi:hypothetical protein